MVLLSRSPYCSIGSRSSGYKVSWVLEELKEAYGIDVTSQTIDITSRVQKESWYLKISPIGKIPALVDHDNGGLALWESSSKFHVVPADIRSLAFDVLAVFFACQQ